MTAAYLSPSFSLIPVFGFILMMLSWGGYTIVAWVVTSGESYVYAGDALLVRISACPQAFITATDGIK